MNIAIRILAPASAVLLAAAPALATPPAGVPHGPPPGVSFGHTEKAGEGAESAMPKDTTHASESDADAASDPGVAKAANLLGKLNAAHASSSALSHASPKSIVGAIAIYKSTTLAAQASVKKFSALVNQDQAAVNADQTTLNQLKTSSAASQAQISAAQAALTSDQQKLASDQAQLAAAQAAIVSAQNALASRTNKPLTPTVIAKLNALLGI
jgi:hypothetical protein